MAENRRNLHGADSGEGVSRAQFVLRDSGFDPGELDGVYGPNTAQAVRDFQQAQGLMIDGLLGPDTWEALRSEPAGHQLSGDLLGVLHGATGGDDVRSVQATLRDAGYDPGTVDGVYGPATARAVARFQQDQRLTTDGVVGPATWAALDASGLPQPEPRLRVVGGFRSYAGAPLLDVGFVGGQPIAVVRDGTASFGHVDLLTGNRTGHTSAERRRLTALTIPYGQATSPVVVSGWSDGSVRVKKLIDGALIGEQDVDGYRGDTAIGAAVAGGSLLVWVPADASVWRAVRFPLGADQAGRQSSWLEMLPLSHSALPVAFTLDGRPVVAGLGEVGIVVIALDTGDVIDELQVDPDAIHELHVAGAPATPVLVARTHSGPIVRWRPGGGGGVLPAWPELVGEKVRLVATGARSLVIVTKLGLVWRYDAGSSEPVGEEIAVAGPGREPVTVTALAVADDAGATAIAALDKEGRLYCSVTGASGWRQPNPTVARDYWSTEDNLGYEAYARAIVQFIEHQDTRPPLTIGIKGAWGAGKTSVMRMVQRMLDPPLDPRASVWEFRELRLTEAARSVLTRGKRSGQEQDLPATTLGTVLDRTTAAPTSDLDFGNEKATADAPKVRRPTVWFNPWMYQTGEQVWAGLAHEVITQVTGRLSPTQRERFWLELNLRRVNREELRRKIYGIVLQRLVVPGAVVAAGALAALVLALVGAGAWVATGLVPILTGLGSARANIVRLRRRPAADTLPWMVDGPVALQWDQLVTEPDYRGRAGFLYFLHADMKNVLDLVATPDRPLVVFIDDLDRCSPGVVAQTIEAVNLFLAGEFPNCIFVLAIEPAVVAAHIETAHKDLVDKLVEQGLVTDWSELGWRFLEKIIQLPLALPPPRPAVARDYVLSLFTSTDGDQGSVAESATEARDEDLTQAELARLEQEAPEAGLAAIPTERAQVEQRLREQPGLDDEAARQIAGEVALRRFRRSFSDDDEQVRRVIVREALALPTANPREMKRLVNLFRFYALVVNERRLLVEAPSQDEVFAQVARLAALSSRWPHLLGAFGARTAAATDPDDAEDTGTGEQGSIALERLEQAARASEEAWNDALVACGLLGKTAHLTEPTGLRDFLRQDPPIAVLARELL